MRLKGIRPTLLEPLASNSSGRANDLCPVAGSGEKLMDLAEEIAWLGNTLNFGDILNMEGPLVEIGLCVSKITNAKSADSDQLI